MRWPSTGRGRGSASRPAARPNCWPPLFGSGMSAGAISSMLSGPLHNGLPAALGIAGRFLSGPTTVQAGSAMFTATCVQHGDRLVDGMQGAFCLPNVQVRWGQHLWMLGLKFAGGKPWRLPEK